MFKIDSCVLTRHGDVRYNMTIFCQKSSIGPLKLTLEQAAFKNETTLKTAIQNAYIARGEHLALTFYDERGYAWSEIRDIFADNLPVLHEIDHLGADERCTVHFPNCVVNGQAETITEQQPLITFNEEAVRSYQAIVPNAIARFDAIPYLWCADTAEHAALAAGIAHVVGQILSGIINRRNGVAHYPQHLAYVDISPQTWMPCVKQLSQIFAGTDYVPHIPQANALQHMRELTDLNCLPYICQFPNLSVVRARNLIQQTPVSLLTLVENEQGEQISPEDNVWFLALEQMNPQLPGLLPSELIALIRQEFPALLMYFLNISQSWLKRGWMTGTNPIVQVYDWIAESLHIENSTPARVANMCKKYYVAYGYHTARSFFHELKRMFFAGGSAYTAQRILRGDTRPKETFAVFEDRKQNVVYVHHHVADIMNQQNRKANFNKDVLTKELTDADYLARTTDEPYWILRGDVWQTHVANQIKMLPTVPITGEAAG